MGAPHWDPHARGAILGLTRGTTRAHLARATLEAIAFEVRDVVDVMVAEAGLEVPELSADGGASANDLLMQLQADQLGVPVRRPVVTETTALGRGLPGRARHRRVGLDRRAGADLGTGPAVRARARTAGRRPARPLARRPRPRRQVDLLTVETQRLLLPLFTSEDVAAIVGAHRLPHWAPDFPADGDREIAAFLERDRDPLRARCRLRRPPGRRAGRADWRSAAPVSSGRPRTAAWRSVTGSWRPAAVGATRPRRCGP